jgi:hypothetical protein
MTAVKFLTKWDKKRTLEVCLNKNRSSSVKCVTTPHHSNPTLMQAVNGLQSSIQRPKILVLCLNCSPTDFLVGKGCFVMDEGDYET